MKHTVWAFCVRVYQKRKESSVERESEPATVQQKCPEMEVVEFDARLIWLFPEICRKVRAAGVGFCSSLLLVRRVLRWESIIGEKRSVKE